MTQGRLSVAIIGAGPVGTVLGQALASAGHMMAGIASSSPKNIERAETIARALAELEAIARAA